jgi:hypothetical protein
MIEDMGDCRGRSGRRTEENVRDLMRDRYLLLDNRFSTTRAAMQDFVSGKVARKQLRSSIGAATNDPGCLPRARRIYE